MLRAVASSPSSRARKRPGPKTPHHWPERYLALVRERGNLDRTARAVGVDPKTARAYRAAHPEYEAEIADALEEAADRLEDDLITQAEASGNPVGYIVRLKALRPAKYIERQATLNLSADLNLLPPEEAKALLGRMLGALTPATAQAMLPAAASAGAEGAGT